MSGVDQDTAARWARARVQGRELDPDGLAYRLEYARALRGLSWSDLARQAGVSRDTVMRYASGRRRGTTLDTMQALAGALGVDAVWLAFGDEA